MPNTMLIKKAPFGAFFMSFFTVHSGNLIMLPLLKACVKAVVLQSFV